MSKFLSLLFIVFLIGIAVFVRNQREQNLPPCPEWATLGKFCETKSLAVTPDESIVVASWSEGLIVLNGSRVDNVLNVKFYEPNGSEILPGSMSEFATYRFVKIGNQGSFKVLRGQNFNPQNLTNIFLAKPIQ